MFLNTVECQATTMYPRHGVGGRLEKEEVASGCLCFWFRTVQVAVAATFHQVHLLEEMFTFCHLLNH